LDNNNIEMITSGSNHRWPFVDSSICDVSECIRTHESPLRT